MGIGPLPTTHPDAQSALRELCERQNVKVFGFGEYHTPLNIDPDEIETTTYLTAHRLLPYLVREQNVRVVGSEKFGHSHNELIEKFLSRKHKQPQGELATLLVTGESLTFLEKMRKLRKKERGSRYPHPLQLRGIGPDLGDMYEMVSLPITSVWARHIQAINDRAVRLAVSSRGLLESGGKLLLYTGIGHIRHDLSEIGSVSHPSYVNNIVQETGIDAAHFLGISLLLPEIVLNANVSKVGEKGKELCQRAPRSGVHLRQDTANLYTMVFARAASRRITSRIMPKWTGRLRSAMARMLGRA